MLQPTTLGFLNDLKTNNNKPWLDANRPAYEAAKADFVHLVTNLIDALSGIDPGIAQTPLEAKKCIFRINRDVRFSTNKSPYKTNFGAWFNKGGKQSPTAGYYVNLEPGNSFVAGGMYMPDPTTLAAIRQEIDYNVAEFESLLTHPDFAERFDGLGREESLKRPPKGYTAANPAVEYLKLKSFTASHSLPDSDLTQGGLIPEITASFGALQPLVQYLNRVSAER